jgi:hypothetical protein
MKITITILLSLLFNFSFAQLITINGNANTSTSSLIGQNYYHVSESIYLNAEIGNSNFTSSSNAINVISFNFSQIGNPSTINNFKIWMKNISSTVSTFSNGTYATNGYTLVFNGSINANTVAWNDIKLSTPFIRTTGSNLQILIERLDGVLHTANIGFTNGFVTTTANGNSSSLSALSSRRYNGTNSPTSTTSLSVTAFRPAISLNHKSNYDIAISEIIHPTISCYSNFKDIKVRIANLGTDTIFQNQATITLKIGGANRSILSLNNPTNLLPGDSSLITFSNVNLTNPGNNFDTCIVFKSGDIINSNDTIYSSTTTASSINTFPINEDVESVPVAFSFSEKIQGSRQLWSIQNGSYSNDDQIVSLAPRLMGSKYFLFDAYSGSNSVGVISRLYSKCINLPRLSPTITSRNISLSFWMSHDNTNYTANDSLYVVISTNQGITWNRLVGFQRSDELLTEPTWLKDSVDLSIYAGQTIQLGFEGVSNYGNAFGLDDIALTVDPYCNNPVTVFAGNNASICSNKNYTLLSGNPSLGGAATSAIWKTSGTGTFLNNNTFGSALTYQPSTADSTLGNVTISLVSNGLSNSVCEQDSASFNLIINPNRSITQFISTCSSYVWQGQTFTSSGIYTWNGTSAKGCDSIIQLQLTINTPSTSATNITRCESYIWNGQTYSNSGIYSFNSINAKGCDSTAFLNLIINNSSTSNLNVTHCGNYIWNGNTYTTSGTYTFTTNNALGCDSFSVLTLQINNCTNELNVKVFLEGLYQEENLMKPYLYNLELSDSSNACDSIEAYLWNVNHLNNESPDFSAKTILKTNGMAHFILPPNLTGDHYIALKHRNSIEIWSAVPVSFPTSNLYDFSLFSNTFTDGINSSQKLMSDGNYAMYTGDVNQDGTIDIFDQQNVDNAVMLFEFGYLINDCNADGVEDVFDIQIVENNTSLFLFYSRPY